MIVRPQEPGDYDAAKVVYAEAFRRGDHLDLVPLEVGIFAALWEANDVIDELSFTALAENSDVVGHVTASRAMVGSHSVVAVGPIGVLPGHQAKGIGTALMSALLDAADAQNVPLVVLLGSPEYYGRFGFRPAGELGVVSPEPKWGSAFQARPLSAYTPAIIGPFEYAPAFSSQVDVTITSYVRPPRLVLEASGKPHLRIAYALTRMGDETDLESDDFRPRGILRVVFPLLAPVIRRDVPKQFASLKALCER